MSIASTKQALGYVARTEGADNCGACARASAQEWPQPTGLRCTEGAFFTTRQATCRKFLKAQPAPKVQIGPTDI